MMLGGVVVFIGSLTAGVVFSQNAYGRYQCEQYARVTGRATHYVNFDGCYVQRDGKWMRWDEYKLAYATAGDAK